MFEIFGPLFAMFHFGTPVALTGIERKSYQMIPQITDAQFETVKSEGKSLPLLNETLAALNKNTKNTVKVYTVFLNKVLADFLLKFNLKHPNVTNRPINWSIVESMSRQILNGHFRNTGEPLLFTDTGIGIDLQHRCNAVLKAAETNPEVGYETTILTGIHVDSIESLIDNLLVMGVAKRTKMNLAHFANVDAHKWEMVEYYMLPEDTRTGNITKALSKLEINDEYKAKRQYYDSVYQTISALFETHEVNIELSAKRIPIFAASALKMFDIDNEKGMKFMQAFFNPLENTLPKGNPVDAIRQELVALFQTGQRDKTRPIFIRRAMMVAFKEFLSGHVRTKWPEFVGVALTVAPVKPKLKAKAAVAAAAPVVVAPSIKLIPNAKPYGERVDGHIISPTPAPGVHAVL